MCINHSHRIKHGISVDVHDIWPIKDLNNNGQHDLATGRVYVQVYFLPKNNYWFNEI